MSQAAPPVREDPILEQVREFYESHHDGIERSRQQPPLLLRPPDPHSARAGAAGRARARPGLRRRPPAGGARAVARRRDRRVGARHSRGARAPWRRAAQLHRRRRGRSGAARAIRGAVRHDPADQRRHAPDRRAGDARGAACGEPPAHAGPDLQLQPPVAAAAAPRRALRHEVPAAARGLAAARGDQGHARARGLRGRPRRLAPGLPRGHPARRRSGQPLPRPAAARRRVVAGVRHHRAPRAGAERREPQARPERERRDPVPQRGRSHRAARREPAEAGGGLGVPVRGGQLHGRHRGHDRARRGRSPRAAAALLPTARQGQGRRRPLRLRAGQGRRAPDPRLRPGCRTLRRAQVRRRRSRAASARW